MRAIGCPYTCQNQKAANVPPRCAGFATRAMANHIPIYTNTHASVSSLRICVYVVMTNVESSLSQRVQTSRGVLCHNEICDLETLEFMLAHYIFNQKHDIAF